MDTDKLAVAFQEDLLDAYHEAKTACKYNAARFIQMLEEYGGVETARQLLKTGDATQTGLYTLWLCKRLDLSVEAKVLLKKYRSLFDDEIRAVARKRLEDREFNVDEYLKAYGESDG